MGKDREVIEKIRASIYDATVTREGCEYIAEEADMNKDFGESAQQRRKE